MVPGDPIWREFDANEITHSAAHYLLAVASLARDGEAPRAADLARELAVSRAAVSLQLRTLREQGLVTLDEERRLHLTRTAADLVARIESKHEILRVFFAEVLGVSPEVAERDACKMEHLMSEASGAGLVRMIRFLRSGHPAAVQCLQAFSDLTARCPQGRRCDLCTEVCLLSASGRR